MVEACRPGDYRMTARQWIVLTIAFPVGAPLYAAGIIAYVVFRPFAGGWNQAHKFFERLVK